MNRAAALAAMNYMLDAGIDIALGDEPIDRFKLVEPPPKALSSKPPASVTAPKASPQADIAPVQHLGKAEAYNEAVKLAQKAQSLDELQAAISEFDGIAIKKTATNMVFADGNPKADIMLIGEAPGADEDRQGKPFVGVSGQLLDKILSSIGLDRASEDAAKSVYISNIINWRPPGNRTPNPAEIEVSLPFIERHIQLIQPKLLIFCGGVSAKALLGTPQSLSKLRKTVHDYRPQTEALHGDASTIPAIATYHPAYLLRTPSQKKAVWADMLAIKEKQGL